jgi:hypothetical protein
MIDENGPHYFAVFHSPGPSWIKDLPYNEQPRFMDHVGYISGWHDKGKIVLSGPFMDAPAAWPASWRPAAWRS